MGESGTSTQFLIAVFSGTFGIAGVVVGAFLRRWLDRVGEIHIDVKILDAFASGVAGPINEKAALPIEHDAFRGAMEINFWVEVVLFNEKDVTTGLRDIAVILKGEGVEDIKRPLFKAITTTGSEARENPPIPERVRVFNLPPGEFAHQKLMFNLDAEILSQQGKDIERYTEAKFGGVLPNGKARYETIEFPHHYPGVLP